MVLAAAGKVAEIVSAEIQMLSVAVIARRFVRLVHTCMLPQRKINPRTAMILPTKTTRYEGTYNTRY